MKRFLISLLLLSAGIGCAFVVHDVLGFPAPDRNGRLSFSHRKHLSLMLSQEGKPWESSDSASLERACQNCHSLRKDGREYNYPGHAQCRTCHPQVDGELGCELCHGVPKPKDGTREPPPGTGELIFNHTAHTQGKVEQDCTDCHAKIQDSTRAEDNNIPSMWDCRDCHGGANAMEGASWRCQTCHLQYTEGDIPPPQLAQTPEIPVDHDQSFLQTHGRIAMRPGAACDRCHDDLSCDRCHTLTPPRDHNLRFTKNLHGREATFDRERCAVCHEAGFCVSCHAIGPQTHFDDGFRLLGGHAQQARRAIRSCLACHQFAGFCDTPGCHLITEDRTGQLEVIR